MNERQVADVVKGDYGKIDFLVHSVAVGPEVTKPLLETSRMVSGKEERGAVDVLIIITLVLTLLFVLDVVTHPTALPEGCLLGGSVVTTVLAGVSVAEGGPHHE